MNMPDIPDFIKEKILLVKGDGVILWRPSIGVAAASALFNIAALVVVAILLACLLKLRFASGDLKGNREVVLAAVKKYGRALEFADKAFRNDKEIVLAAVKQDGYALEFASEALKDDREVVLAAVNQNVWAAVNQNGCALKYASDALKGDREVVLAAVKQDGCALEFADKAFRNDKEIVLAAVKQDGCALEYASDGLKDDREVVLASVKQDGWVLEFADVHEVPKEIVMGHLFNSWPNLRYARAEVQKEIIMADPIKLEFAGRSIKIDKDLVLKIVKKNSMALKFADGTLRSDPEVLINAAAQDINSLQYANDGDNGSAPRAQNLHGSFGEAQNRAMEEAKKALIDKTKRKLIAAVRSTPGILRHLSGGLFNNITETDIKNKLQLRILQESILAKIFLREEGLYVMAKGLYNIEEPIFSSKEPSTASRIHNLPEVCAELIFSFLWCKPDSENTDEEVSKAACLTSTI